MHPLDETEKIKKIDQGGMYDFIYKFPSQFEDALELTKETQLPDWDKSQIKSIVVAGLGGSAIGGDLVRSYLTERLDIPFFISRNYTLPNFVDSSSLVFVSSYSGNTEETLSAFEDASGRDAKIICITSNGKVENISSEEKIPCVHLPKGFQPRAALGYSFVPILTMLERLGFVQGEEDNIKKTKEFLISNRNKYLIEVNTEENEAKKLATKLHGKLPIIYAACDHFDAVSTRWKGQFCENAKMLAFNNVFPEFNHNELVGWKVLSDYRDDLMVVILKDKEDHPRIQRRMEIARDIIEKQEVEVIEIQSCGENLLSRMFSLIQLGDFTSFYLAVLNNEDPTPVKVIDYLKNELAKQT
ncbi:MAG: bifunctional phosphoglucose/phosphomannose isomerase [candidate division Zixibacteria bacterium]|nr:bifunctional phosphoglucose/phosphomannose isomerase [candidate division Zixibacteria bacterium]